MAQHAGKSYTDFTNVSAGGYRFSSQYSSAETDTGEISVYVRGDSLKFWNGTAETDITSGGSGVSTWDGLYDLDKSMTIDDSTVTFAGTLASGNVFTITGSAATTGNLIDITNAGSGKDIDGTSSTWSVTSAGAGDFVSVTGDTVVAGTGAAAGIFASSGNYDVTIQSGNGTTSKMTITDGANGDVTFAMNGTGKVVISGTTETNTSFSVTNGDAVVADGSLTITDDDQAASLTVTNATTSNTASMVVLTADAMIDQSILYIDNGGASLTTGYYINCNDDGVSDFTVGADGATIITTAVATTQALKVTGIQTSESMVLLDNTSGVIADDKAILYIDAGGNIASGGTMVRMVPTGTPNAGAMGLEFVGASKDMIAMYVDVDSATNSGIKMNSGGAIADNKAVLEITADGTPAATGSNLVRIDGSGATATNKPTLLEIDGHGKDEIGLFIDADSVGNVALINGGGNIANDTGVLQLTADGATQSAGGTVLRVVNSGTPNAGSIGIEGVFTSKDMIYLYMAGGSATNSAAYIASNGAIADDKAVLELVATGTPAAAGSNVLRVDGSGMTATNHPTLLEVNGDAKDVVAFSTDADPTTLSANIMHSAGALAADKATLELVSDAVSNADSAVLRIEQTNTGGVATCLNLKQDDVDKPFITFETTVDTGNAVQAVAALAITATHYVMVDIEGVGTRYIAVGTIA